MENRVAKAMMRTSGTGVSDRGFTLIEMMVVLLLMGLILGMVTLSFRGSARHRPLADEVAQLAALMNLASDDAALSGQPFMLQLTRQGWRFLQGDGTEWLVVGNHDLPPGTFVTSLDHLKVLGLPEDLPQAEIRFDTETSLPGDTLILERQGEAFSLQPDALGHYAVVPSRP